MWRTGHAADRPKIQKQMVRSHWCGQSLTRKIEEKKNMADEIGRGGHRVKQLQLEESGLPQTGSGFV